MKIAYIVPALVNRGPVIVVKELVNQMLKAGNECWVFYFDGMTELTFPCPTIRVHFLRKLSLIDLILYILMAYALIYMFIFIDQVVIRRDF